MDITFQTPEGRFNYRVAAVIAHRERLLVMRDDAVSHYSLPAAGLPCTRPRSRRLRGNCGRNWA